MKASNLWAHCALGEISLLHTHLEWAHLLISRDPREWLALLFSVQTIEICLSLQDKRASIFHTWVRRSASSHLHYDTSWLEGCCVALTRDSVNIILPRPFSSLTFLSSSSWAEGREAQEAEVMAMKHNTNGRDVIETLTVGLKARPPQPC